MYCRTYICGPNLNHICDLLPIIFNTKHFDLLFACLYVSQLWLHDTYSLSVIYVEIGSVL